MRSVLRLVPPSSLLQASRSRCKTTWQITYWTSAWFLAIRRITYSFLCFSVLKIAMFLMRRSLSAWTRKQTRIGFQSASQSLNTSLPCCILSLPFFFCHLPAKRRRPYTSPGTLAISPPHTPLSSAASTIGWAIMWGTGRKSTKTSQNGAEVDKVGEGAYWHRAKCRTQIFSHRGRWYRLAWQSIFRHAFACKSRFHGGHRKLVLALMWMAFPTSFPFRSAPTILYFKT